MLRMIAPIASLLLGATILMLAQGLFLVLVPLTIAEAGHPAQTVGFIVSSYFAGFVFGAWTSTRAIHRVGYVRTYGGLIAWVLAAALSLPLFPEPLGWVLLRFVHGAAVSGVFLAIESWLNTGVPKDWRGRVLGTYSLLSLAALGAGQLLINVYGAAGFAPFTLGAILLSLSIVPVVLSRIEAPSLPVVEVRLNTDLMRQVPLGLAVGLLSGLLSGSFWTLAPLFAATFSPGTSEATWLIGSALLGGVLLQLPIGYLSDRTDRRSVILGVAAVGAATSLILMMVSEPGGWLLYTGFLIYGGMIFSLHPLALTYCADRAVGGEEMLSLSQGLLLVNGLGLASGPLLSSLLATHAGPDALFLFSFVATVTGAAYAGLRIRQHDPVSVEDRSGFLPVMETTPAQIPLDPRTNTPGSPSFIQHRADR